MQDFFEDLIGDLIEALLGFLFPDKNKKKGDTIL